MPTTPAPNGYHVQIFLTGTDRPLTFVNVATHIIDGLDALLADPTEIITLTGGDGRIVRIRTLHIAAVSYSPGHGY